MFNKMAQLLEICAANMTDSYKLTHWRFKPKGLTKVYSYLEARSDSDFSDETCFFGLQYFIKRYLVGQVVTYRDLPRIRAFCKHHFYGVDGLFNENGWKYIIEKHGGRLPASIKAVAEGTVMKTGHVMMTIENTDKECAWLTNFLETILVEVWNTITVASLSRAMKKNQYVAMKETMDDDALIKAIMPSRVHDFGFRGVSSPETAALSGAAHLVNFAGTDTTVGVELITQFYAGNEFREIFHYDSSSTDEEWNYDRSYELWDAFYAKHMPGFSIPATEHSQMTIRGPEGEAQVCESLLKEFPDGFVACVSDSFDLFNCITEIWGNKLKDQVLNRNGVLVVRPDSGDPVVIVPMVLEAIGSKFGYRTNNKGYKILNDKVRVIQGDGVNVFSHKDILDAIIKAGWSVENIAFGSGGGLLQKVNRDTFSFAFKACWAVLDGQGREVFKRPKTDPKKNSKRGQLALVLENGEHKTVPLADASKYESGDLLSEVFRDGDILVDWMFDAVRKNAELKELTSAT